MQCFLKCAKLSAAFALAVFALPNLTPAQHYTETDLVSDISGKAPIVDPNLRNPWGLTRSSGSPWWVGNNNSGTSTVYGSDGTTATPAGFLPDPPGGPFDNFVIVPPPGFALCTQSAPTGPVFNGSRTDFLLDKGTPAGLPAVFIFATEDGTISGWDPGANVAKGAKPPSINAVLEVDNSDNGSANGAVYKGATSAE